MDKQLLPFSLLLVDDDPLVIASLKRTLLDVDCQIFTAKNGYEALEKLAQNWVHVAIVDLKMPQMDGMTLLYRIKKEYAHVHVIILTGHGGVRQAVEAVRMGATDFLEKPFSPESLIARIRQMPRTGDTLAEYEQLAIQNALQKTNGHRRRAAQLLKIGESTLYRKMNQYGLVT